eukprot:c28167_g1_i1 orf=66-2351(+)
MAVPAPQDPTWPAAAPGVLPSALHFGPGMLEHIRNLTDVGEMTRLLHESIAYQRGIDNELEALLSQRHELEKKLNGLYKSAEVLELVKADSDQMLSSVRSTCDLADRVSSKVRELDLAQSRVQATLGRIDAIVDRANCIDGAKRALESEDYEAAAKYVETFLHLDAEYSDTIAAREASGEEGRKETASEQRRQLLESKQNLESVIRKKFSAAVEQRDHPGVLRFVKLFRPLGLEDEGLQLYVNYLRKVISLRAGDRFEVLVEAIEQIHAGKSAPEPDFVGSINELFKDIAVAVQENEEILRTLSGEDGIVYAIKELQAECDSRGTLLLKRYMDFRRLGRIEKEIASHNNVNLITVGVSEGPDPRQIENFLEEMLSISQSSEDYMQFMMTKIREAETAGAQLSPRAANVFRNGAYNRSVQDLTVHYIVLEEYFMGENVRKAIRIDEFVPDALTSSMVDDVFYVLQSCSRRAISTANVQSVLAALNSVINLLNNEFKEALHRKIREPNLGAKLFSGGVGIAKVGTEVATSLNNVDISSEYVLKLRHELEEHCSETFSAPADRDKVKSCLAELGETNNIFRQLLNAGLEQLSNSVTPRLRIILDSVGVISYELTEAQYAENEVNNPWVQKLLHTVDTSAAWLQSVMTTNIYDSFVHLIIDFIVKRLEVIMMQKHFNQLGGLQLDRDARALVGHFSAMTQRTVRDKFARLTQMATILNLEKVSEILDYWGENSGPMTWRLTPAEVRRILSLRVDFKSETIQSLRL